MKCVQFQNANVHEIFGLQTDRHKKKTIHFTGQSCNL